MEHNEPKKSAGYGYCGRHHENVADCPACRAIGTAYTEMPSPTREGVERIAPDIAAAVETETFSARGYVGGPLTVQWSVPGDQANFSPCGDSLLTLAEVHAILNGGNVPDCGLHDALDEQLYRNAELRRLPGPLHPRCPDHPDDTWQGPNDRWRLCGHSGCQWSWRPGINPGLLGSLAQTRREWEDQYKDGLRLLGFVPDAPGPDTDVLSITRDIARGS